MLLSNGQFIVEINPSLTKQSLDLQSAHKKTNKKAPPPQKKKKNK